MKNIRITSFPLIILASFLFLFSYVTNPKVKGAVDDFGLSIFGRNTTIILTGDVMIGRSVMTKSIQENDYTYPFKKIAEKLKKANLVFINLENPIIENCPETNTGMIFCARPEMVEGLTFAGIDIVTLANNHSKNYGQKGLEETIQSLNKNNIRAVGYGNLIIKKIKRIKYGFLGFDFLTKIPKETDYNLIQESKNKVDVLIVGIHWGNEYASKPTRYQKEWAKKIVEQGADVIAGHHPHWVQEKEEINGKPVYYSLGNLIFDQMWSEKTKQGLVVELTFRDGKLTNTTELPTYMSSWAQPEFVE